MILIRSFIVVFQLGNEDIYKNSLLLLLLYINRRRKKKTIWLSFSLFNGSQSVKKLPELRKYMIKHKPVSLFTLSFILHASFCFFITKKKHYSSRWLAPIYNYYFNDEEKTWWCKTLSLLLLLLPSLIETKWRIAELDETDTSTL